MSQWSPQAELLYWARLPRDNYRPRQILDFHSLSLIALELTTLSAPVSHPPSQVYRFSDLHQSWLPLQPQISRYVGSLPENSMQRSEKRIKRRHELEGTPDPFPSLNDSPVKSRASKQQLDTESETAFPSLAPSGPAAGGVAKPAWGLSGGPRIKVAASNKQPLATDSFSLTDIDLSSAGKDGKPVHLGEIMKAVMSKYKIKIEASTNQKDRQTTFHLKADSQKDLAKARRELLSSLSPVVSD